jgi:hypothetical protein
MITGTDLLQISRARVNMDRTDLEAAGVVDHGEAGDKARSNFGRDMDTFIFKLPQRQRAALAEAIQRQAGQAVELSHQSPNEGYLTKPKLVLIRRGCGATWTTPFVQFSGVELHPNNRRPGAQCNATRFHRGRNTSALASRTIFSVRIMSAISRSTFWASS